MRDAIRKYWKNKNVVRVWRTMSAPRRSQCVSRQFVVAGAMPFVVAVVLSATTTTAFGQESPELARQAQNPIASLISVPFQNNFNFDAGSKDDLQNVLNIQPVIPFQISNHWNLITRTIVPVIHQPELAPGIRTSPAPATSSFRHSPSARFVRTDGSRGILDNRKTKRQAG